MSGKTLSTLFLFLVFFTMNAKAQYMEAGTFPKAAPGAYGIQMETLDNGAMAVWNGNTLYRQTMPGGEAFHAIASGYAGDPGFLAVAPDGHTLLLGAGYGGQLYLVNADAPANYVSGSEVATLSHYAGQFLTQDLVLLERAQWPYAELGVLDLRDSSYRTVMYKPGMAEVDGVMGGFGASARLAVDATRTWVYVMSVVYDASFMVARNELKRIPVSALVSAHAAEMMLDWTADAQAIGASGDFNDGGPAVVTRNGLLAIGGFGSVQLVDPELGLVVDSLAPRGFDYYAIGYNRLTDSVYPIVSDVDWSMDLVYIPEGELSELPAAGPVGFVVLAGSLLALYGVSKRIGTLK